MGDNGKIVLEMICQMQELYVEIATYYKAIDKYMYKKGYKEINNSSQILKDVSRSFDSPEKWLPTGFYRSYSKESKEDMICFNIALGLSEHEEKVTEPIAIIARIKYNDISRRGDWDSWSIYFYSDPFPKEMNKLYQISESRKDIDLNTEGLKSYGWKEVDVNSINKVQLLAVPLMDINDETTIVEKLIKPVM